MPQESDFVKTRAGRTISVIVPAYNSAADLRVCLEHCQRSTLAPLEILVSDDGSTDDSAAVAESLGARVIPLRQRRGPSVARNVAAMQARGDILFFVDADVALHPDALERVANSMEADPTIDAIMGAYDDFPAHPGFLSQYKNLVHSYFHRTGNREANTFWSGCGAIRRQVFLEAGGFPESYSRPSIEDIDFGYRLKRAGRRIVLDPSVQGSHRKEWTFVGLVKTDIFYRAIPWAEIIYRTRSLPDDLNLRWSQRISTLLVYALVLLGAALTNILIGGDGPAIGTGLGFVAVLFFVIAINSELFRFLAARRGLVFALMAIPFFLLYQFYSGIAFVAGTGLAAWRSEPAAEPAEVRPLKSAGAD